MRVLLLSIALGVAALSEGHDAIRFVHPKRAFLLAGPGGVDVPVQAFFPPHADNRWVQIERHQDESVEILFAKSADGDNERALQPIEKFFIRAHAGVFVLRALACRGEREGRCVGVRESARLEVRVCGGEESCH